MKKTQQVFLIFLVTLFLLGGSFYFWNFYTTSVKGKYPVLINQISTLILPHHDLAKTERQSLLRAAASQNKPQIIILISPDHFNSGDGISTTTKDWKLVNAVVEPQKEKINQLVDKSVVVENELAFKREHGIFNILEDVKNNFPDAKIIPIIIRNGVSYTKIKDLNRGLIEVCPRDCLLVASVDFSHYQPGALAEVHDAFSIKALESMDVNALTKAEVDSPESLILAVEWARAKGTTNFYLQSNTNSGKIANEPDQESTSYVFGWFQKNKTASSQRGQTVMIGGDMMFGRHIDYKFHKKLTDSVKNLGERFFMGVNVSLVNLEGPISQEKTFPQATDRSLIFNFPPETINVLKWLRINVVSLANNHTLNQGESGFVYTQKILNENKIFPVGKENEFSEKSIYYNEQSKISVLAVNLLATNANLEKAISQEKNKGNFVIVFPHWGAEYQKKHNSYQEKLAHSWIDAGADLVVGSHPHVVQDAEVYQNKPIFYSLGNLVFDQTWSIPTQRGLVLAMEILPDKIKIVLLPTISKNLQVEIARGEERFEVIKDLKRGLGQEINKNDYGYDTIEISRN